MEPHDGGCRLTLATEFTITFPLPRLLRGLAEKVIVAENTRVLGRYVENLAESLNATASR